MRIKQKNQLTLFDNILTEDCIEIDPILQEIFTNIEKNSQLLDLVHQDLCKGLKNPKTGRKGLSAKQVLGFNIVKIRENLSYQRTRDWIADSMSLRILLEFGFGTPVQKKKAFIEATHCLSEETVRQLNELIVKFAEDAGLEKGKKVRTDSTAVESNIHYPTDNTLMRDVVRVITRNGKRLLDLYPESSATFASRQRAVGRRSQNISRSKSKSRRKKLFGQLIRLVTEVVTRSAKLREEDLGPCTDPAQADAIRKLLADYEALGLQIIDQCRRRIFEEEQVPAKEKIVSIFEIHADIIIRGKVGKPVEFGHKVLLVEGESGLITDYEVLDGNPPDYQYLLTMMKRHKKIFEKYPELVAGDRGFYSGETEEACKNIGIEKLMIPKKGYKNKKRRAYEKTPAFKKGQKFRNGVEGRISVLKRKYGMSRCMMKGEKGFELFIGLCVLAHNMTKLAELLIKPKKGGKMRGA